VLDCCFFCHVKLEILCRYLGLQLSGLVWQESLARFYGVLYRPNLNTRETPFNPFGRTVLAGLTRRKHGDTRRVEVESKRFSPLAFQALAAHALQRPQGPGTPRSLVAATTPSDAAGSFCRKASRVRKFASSLRTTR
jgi:hypothetical protein